MTPHPEHGLLDTSVIILLRHLPDPLQLPIQSAVRTVTLAELSAGPLLAQTDTERAERLRHLQQAESDFEPLPFDIAAARAFAGVAVSLRRAGRTTSARAYDALIAATAIANGLPLYTCNPGDFSGIDGLEVMAVPQPG